MNRLDFNSSRSYRNNFILLKLLAAYLVLISHSYDVLQKTTTQPALRYNDKSIVPGDIGLYIFFTISGFLVTQSLFDSDSLFHYVWKRFLRIFPALVVANVVCILIGCFISDLPIIDYLSNKATWFYLFKNSTLVNDQFYLPGVFTGLKDHIVNASLPTILIGAGCSMFLAIGAYFIVIRKWLFITCFILFETVRIYLTIINPSAVKGIDLSSIFNLGTYFYLGSLLFVLKDDIRFEWFYANIVMAVALLTVYTFAESITISIFFAYCFIIIGTSAEIVDLKGHDFSYGVYLYSFPVQQLLVLYSGYSTNLWLHILLSIVFSTAVAYFSWNFIEKPLIRKKNLLKIK